MKLEEKKEEVENELDDDEKKARRAANRKNPIKQFAKKSNVIIQPAIPQQPKINPPKIKPQEQIHQENFKNIFNKVKNLDLYIDKVVKHKAEKDDKDNNKKDTNEEFLNNIEKQNKEIANHEKVALITIDDIITELEGLTTKTLTAKKRKEVNEKLKEVDGSNIGAIKNVDKAIERLQSKKETINKSKELIEQRKKATSEADRKISRSVPKNQNIVNVANFPANDDESDFSVKKKNKDKPHFSGLEQIQTTPKTPKKNK
jgi:chromosome segregation ATPase